MLNVSALTAAKDHELVDLVDRRGPKGEAVLCTEN